MAMKKTYKKPVISIIDSNTGIVDSNSKEYAQEIQNKVENIMKEGEECLKKELRDSTKK